jgi:formate dehydrogenase assembly factor FdhD
MCTPERLDELVVGWLFGEGYIDRQSDIVRMRPCTSELGFWVEVPADKYDAIERAERRRVLASGLRRRHDDSGLDDDVPADGTARRR